LRLVELRHGGFALGAVALRVGALGWRVLLRLRAELIEPRPGAVEARLNLVDGGADALPERVDLLPDALQVGIVEVAGERRVVLVELCLEGLELGPSGAGLVRDRSLPLLYRRCRCRGRRRRLGLSRPARTGEERRGKGKPEEKAAHRSCPELPRVCPASWVGRDGLRRRRNLDRAAS
jgi:hypothetical protein